MENSKVSIQNMDLYYGDFHALKNLNLEIPANQVTAFIGPSGCGKSTCIKTLNRMNDLVAGCVADDRFGFEETAWLLLFGELPSRDQLKGFSGLLSSCRELPDYFAEDMIIKAPSPNIMNKLARSVLALYSYDDLPDDLSMENVLRQSIELLSLIHI